MLATLPTPSLANIRGQSCTLEVNGKPRRYFIHLPPNYTGDSALPLVILLHGGGGNYKNALRISGFDKKADREGFILVIPNGTGPFKKVLLTWNSLTCCGYAKDHQVDDVTFMRMLIERLEHNLRVDPKQVFVAGESNGGMLAYLLASELSDRIAAIAPVAACMNGCEHIPAYPVSVIAFNGTADKVVLYNGGIGHSSVSHVQVYAKPAAYAVSFWAQADQCTRTQKGTKHKGITYEIHTNEASGAEVALYTIKDGQHAWPGGEPNWHLAARPTREISATDLIWDFFSHHPKR